jgi:hypothetical protein
MKYYLQAFLFCCLSFIVVTVPAPAQDAKHYTCYRAKDRIVADGLLNEPDWDRAEWSDDFVDITGNPGLKPLFRTRIKMLWDDRNLYLAAELQEPQIWATIQKRDAVIFKDNDFEVFLDPGGKGLNYYEIEVNALGTIWDLMLTKAYKDQGRALSSWNLKGLKAGIHIGGTLNDASQPDTSWTVEMVLPLSGLMPGNKPGNHPAGRGQWRVNFSRVEWKTEVQGSVYHKKTDPSNGKDLPEDNWVWSPMREVNMHIPERWGRLEFSDENTSNPGPLPFKTGLQKKGFRIWM